MPRLPHTAGMPGGVPKVSSLKVSADSGMGVGLVSASGASRWNRDMFHNFCTQFLRHRGQAWVVKAEVPTRANSPARSEERAEGWALVECHYLSHQCRHLRCLLVEFRPGDRPGRLKGDDR